jgi:hypothetical protein
MFPFLYCNCQFTIIVKDRSAGIKYTSENNNFIFCTQKGQKLDHQAFFVPRAAPPDTVGWHRDVGFSKIRAELLFIGHLDFSRVFETILLKNFSIF